ncbi:MAG TPA: S9 family peptidase [Thermoanaerobaculia bacterium]
MAASLRSHRLRPAAFAAFAAAVAVLALFAGAPSASSSDTAKRPIAETDLFRFVWVADPQMSPDGHAVAFVRVAVDAKREGYDTSIWIVPADGGAPPRALTSGRHDGSPRWSPDGRRLAFLRAVEKDGQPQPPQLFLLSLEGGEARALTDLTRGVGSPVWSPDGRAIAFANEANEKDLAKAREEKAEKGSRKEKEGKEKAGAGESDEHESDVRVITRAVYRENGEGYLDAARPSHLWTVPLPADDAAPPPEPRQITRGEFEEEGPAWSPDGKLLYFASRRVKEPYYEPQRWTIYTVPAAGGEPRPAVSFDGSMDAFTLSPDGRRIAWIGSPNGHPERSYDESDLLVAGTSPGSKTENLTASFEGDVGEAPGGDQRPPRGGAPGAPVWSRDGGALYVGVDVHGRGNLMRMEAGPGGTIAPVTTGDRAVLAFTASADASRFALTISTPMEIGDLYALEIGNPAGAAPKLRQLTRFNDELFAGLELTAPEEITYKSFDGREIEAWVQKPPGFDAHRKYPLILDIHGGPHTAYGWTFDHEFQWMAAKGYVVLYPNPRGSSSYGEEFGNVIQYRYPGDDAKDLLAGVDELIGRGYVDPHRLGVTGGSGGGILTNWIVGHSDRFAAAVSQRSIADWAGFWYTADFSQFTRSWFKGAPWEDPADYAARSPITYVTKIKTPLMLIEGEADYRTPSGDGGEQMFRALKYLKRPVVMVRFPGESHELSRSGKPWHRVERLRHIVGWFDKYLQGKTAAYDVP